jgi:hypothetical protein
MSKRLSSILTITITSVLSVPNLLTADFILPEYDKGQSEYFIWESWTDSYTNYTLADVGQGASPFPQGEGNVSTDTDSSTGSSILFQTESPGAFVTSTGGMYSPYNPPQGFLVYNKPSFALQSVLFQTQSGGSLPDLGSASLFYRQEEGGSLFEANAPAGNGFFSSAGSAYAMWEWDLSNHTVYDYFLGFFAEGTSLSLREVWLDNFDDTTDFLGYALRVSTNGSFLEVGSIDHSLAGGDTAQPSYQPGEIVELTPTAKDWTSTYGAQYNHVFVGWAGALSGDAVPGILTFGSEEIEVTAIFAPLTFDGWVGNNINIYVTSPSYSARAQIEADPDGDGLINFMEYALGAPPEAAGGSPEYLPYVEENQNGSMQYVYRRQMAATDLSYVVEISNDLINWNHNADNTGQIYTEEVGEKVFNGDGTETVRVKSVGLENSDVVFFRLSVTLTSDS